MVNVPVSQLLTNPLARLKTDLLGGLRTELLSFPGVHSPGSLLPLLNDANVYQVFLYAQLLQMSEAADVCREFLRQRAASAEQGASAPQRHAVLRPIPSKARRAEDAGALQAAAAAAAAAAPFDPWRPIPVLQPWVRQRNQLMVMHIGGNI